jgi:UDP-N-acetylmuramyl pentapeptide phosphotransferase/UDP-N-acetylglucosamine-1-phosphate transferase
MIEQTVAHLSVLLSVLGPAALAAFFLSLILIMLLRPFLYRHAMAAPNARSSHRAPTPQGGGIAVAAATLLVAWGTIALLPPLLANQSGQFVAVTASAALMAVVGAIDDLRPLPAGARLALQCLAVGIVIAALPDELRIAPQAPWWIERGCLLLGGVWLVNLVNFMDGIDWMTVAEVVPVTGAIALLGVSGAIGTLPALVAAVLLGAILGFAPFNKPVAHLFLGDVGSLPIGLLLGWLLLQLAASGHLAAAFILPLYYVADTGITLGRRIAKRERVWQAHRTHFYQRATDNGFSVGEIVARVLTVNLVLAVLALVSVAASNVVVSLATLAAAGAAVAWLLATFARGRR